MNTGRNSKIHEVSSFIKGLERAARGVIRIGLQVPQEASVTGWMITDTLAVAPGIVRQSGVSIGKGNFWLESPSIDLTLVDDFPLPGHEIKCPVLLRLPVATHQRALSLAIEKAKVNDQVGILQLWGYDCHFGFGHIRQAEELGLLSYDLDRDGDPVGSVILDPRGWGVLAMQISSSASKEKWVNTGLSIAFILEHLRQSRAWPEIADFHKLANVNVTISVSGIASSTAVGQVTAKAVDSQALLAAALQWSFDPQKLKDRDALLPLVIDPESKPWILKPSERKRLLTEAGSLKALRTARRSIRSVIDSAGQKVIDHILQGPPYDLEKEDENLLPHWLQAVRWFAEVIPNLPSAAQVSAVLDRKRVRSRLQRITGPDFRGRKTELEELQAWQRTDNAGPMVVTGIGGVGKSALVARFCLQQAPGTLLLWLDFDRVDLAPDDAVSVLRLLAQQTVSQVPGLKLAEVTEKNWEKCTAALAKALPKQPPPLLILDGFEVAQHVKRHEEIWRLLDLMLQHAPGLRVLVSGRAEVQGLKLRQLPSQAKHLEGMRNEDVRAWLKDHGIRDAKVIDEVARISRGLPLLLQSALYLIRDEGEDAIKGGLGKLQERLVEGFLYRRILDRVIDPELRTFARDALVLRKVDADIITHVLKGSLPPNMPATEVMSRLMQESSLFEMRSSAPVLALGSSASLLHLRPEVRSATLDLMEFDDPEHVRAIDQKAEAFYAQQDLQKPENAAELVYHRLRLGDIAGAEAAWLPSCRDLLTDAEQDLPEAAEKERQWLRQHLTQISAEDDQVVWERDAVARIRDALKRGLDRIVHQVLTERETRLPNSKLVFYDAWHHWRQKEFSAAAAAIESAGLGEGPVARNRSVMAALVARDAGNPARADSILSSVSDPDLWAERQRGSEEALAVQAARVDLTIDLAAEVRLFERSLNHRVPWALSHCDIMLPELSQLLKEKEMLSHTFIPFPSTEEHLGRFLDQIQAVRESANSLFERQEQSDLHRAIPWEEADAVNVWKLSSSGLVQRLSRQGARRWRLAGTTMFLRDACDNALNRKQFDALTFSITGALTAFRGIDVRLRSYQNIDGVLRDILEVGRHLDVLRALTPAQLLKAPHIGRRIREGVDEVSRIVRLARRDKAPAQEFLATLEPHERAFYFYLFSPDPLEVLCNRIANPPSS